MYISSPSVCFVILYENIVYYAFFTARSILIKWFFDYSGRVLSIRKYINVIFLFSLSLGLLTDISCFSYMLPMFLITIKLKKKCQSEKPNEGQYLNVRFGANALI